MSLAQSVVVNGLRWLTSLICCIDASQISQVPERGPLIIVTNHINMLEIPVVYTRLQPRHVTGYVAAVRWEHGWSRWLLEVCQAIPLRRGEPDVKAIRRGLEMLQQGYQVIVMPEGTRSGHGRLQPAHPGVILLALHSGAPILPVAFYGHEDYLKNLKRLRRTDIVIAVGEPFRLESGGLKVTRQVRRDMLDQVMRQLAALLPEKNRGVYTNMKGIGVNYLKFET